ncbi:DUF2189 domain-containing protein [Piscinibacter sakaiensis]|uniref:DUF2189 domain-containing protein n=1 Tax=Piscinibacter sakaiensis TaxID=1547922 RepID=UPI003AAD334C
MNAPPVSDPSSDTEPRPHRSPQRGDDLQAPRGFAVELQSLAWTQPFAWLAAGWRDFRRAPLIGLFYGGCFVAMGWALLAVFEHAPAWTLALSAGFLLMGPLLCLGLYDVSRDLEAGRRPRFGHSLLAWTRRTPTLAIFAFVLLVLEMLWGRASLIVFALSFDGMPDFRGSLLALLDPQNLEFIIAYVAVGAVFAGLIFAVSVVAMPMILDRPTDAITAGLTSLRLVLGQPGVMLLWGALLTLLVVAAMLPWFAGLLVIGPIAGHASWHAYRAAVVGGSS